MSFMSCLIDPPLLYDSKECLDDLSKDLKGELTPQAQFLIRCEQERCTTLHLRQTLSLDVVAHECDSDLGAAFDGRLLSNDLTTVFADGTSERRGLHAATFQWTGSAGVFVSGRLQGMTNVGTHREPFFDPAAQRCKEFLVMEGRLCGVVRRAGKVPGLRRGAQVTAAYRLRLFETQESGAVGGSLEGLLIRFCR